MKTNLAIASIACLVVGTALGLLLGSPRYEFRTTGYVLWRLDKKTGRAQWCGTRAEHWNTISEKEPHDTSDGLPDFGPSASKPQPFTFEEAKGDIFDRITATNAWGDKLAFPRTNADGYEIVEPAPRSK